MRINIPFKKEMKQKVLEGTKYCTSRTKKYGKEGDYFILEDILEDRQFVLVAIIERSMKFISEYCYESEGFDSPEAFKSYITDVIGIKWNDEKILYLHWFGEQLGKKIKEES